MTTNCTNFTNKIGIFLLMISFILVEVLMKMHFQYTSNKLKPLIKIKADHGLSSVRKDSFN
jgi:hypothetical protein